ncbi:hypothetical protein FBU31_000952 [Coemansia sp. 'formosensis']|nr:hypothetical protein FBU31_000952 [Coemansia sp. 'formosensis']
MVCAICLDNLFNISAEIDTTTSNTLGDDNRIAALSCGHTFHLECTTLWHESSHNMNCPMCNVQHIGSILALHIECDLDHAVDQGMGGLGLERLTISDPLGVAELLCKTSLNLADEQAIKHKELEAKAAALKIELDEKNKRLMRKQAIARFLTNKAIRLESQVKGLNTLTERHRSHLHSLQDALNLKKQVIAELEKKIREHDVGLF